MDTITSKSNENVIAAAKLLEKKYRDQTGLYCFEGRKLLLEAAENGVSIRRIFCTPDNFELSRKACSDAEIFTVSEAVYAKLSLDKSPDGIFAIAKKDPSLHAEKLRAPEENDCLFMAVSVRDPGNLGTILRTAAALGVDCVYLSNDCADLYSPKVIRSAMGAVFKLRTVTFDDPAMAIGLLKDRGYVVAAAALTDNAKELGTDPIDGRYCFVAGNEGHGLPKEVLDASSETVIIPMQKGNESLNVASACTILMWECTRRKREKR